MERPRSSFRGYFGINCSGQEKMQDLEKLEFW